MTNILHLGSLCSGIEAASTAFHQVNHDDAVRWSTDWVSEIADHPSAYLATHLHATPIQAHGTGSGIIGDADAATAAMQIRAFLDANHGSIVNLGDMTDARFAAMALAASRNQRLDVLVGGTPCQAFSQAGQRLGLTSQEGQLALSFCRIADELRPKITLWENVSAVTTDKTNAFGCLLASLAGFADGQALHPTHGLIAACGADGKPTVGATTPGWTSAGWVRGPRRWIAWRVLDSQWFGTPQHRSRVFVVAVDLEYAVGIDPRTILFDPRTNDQHAALDRLRTTADGYLSLSQCTVDMIAVTIRRSLTQHVATQDRTQMAASAKRLATDLRGSTITVPVPYTVGQHNIYRPGVGTMRESGGDIGNGSETIIIPVRVTIDREPSVHVSADGAVSVRGGSFTPVTVWPARKLSVDACERQMGFPANATACLPLSARFSALGNTMNVQVMRWLAERITTALIAPPCADDITPGDALASIPLDDQHRLILIADAVITLRGVQVGTDDMPTSATITPVAAMIRDPQDLLEVPPASRRTTRRTTSTPASDAGSALASQITISAPAARGVLLRHLLRLRHIDPLFAKGMIAAIAAAAGTHGQDQAALHHAAMRCLIRDMFRTPRMAAAIQAAMAASGATKQPDLDAAAQAAIDQDADAAMRDLIADLLVRTPTGPDAAIGTDIGICAAIMGHPLPSGAYDTTAMDGILEPYSVRITVGGGEVRSGIPAGVAAPGVDRASAAWTTAIARARLTMVESPYGEQSMEPTKTDDPLVRSATAVGRLIGTYAAHPGASVDDAYLWGHADPDADTSSDARPSMPSVMPDQVIPSPTPAAEPQHQVIPHPSTSTSDHTMDTAAAITRTLDELDVARRAAFAERDTPRLHRIATAYAAMCNALAATPDVSAILTPTAPVHAAQPPAPGTCMTATGGSGGCGSVQMPAAAPKRGRRRATAPAVKSVKPEKAPKPILAVLPARAKHAIETVMAASHGPGKAKLQQILDGTLPLGKMHHNQRRLVAKVLGLSGYPTWLEIIAATN